MRPSSSSRRPLRLAAGSAVVAALCAGGRADRDAPEAPPHAHSERNDAAAPAASAFRALVVSSHGDPSDEEQFFLELMNRARADPAAEAQRIADDYDDPNVTSAVNFFLKERPGVEYTRAENRNAFLTYSAKPPFAFDPALNDAARAHVLLMRENQDQLHQFPGEAALGQRITDAGYVWTHVAENIYAFARSMVEAHAAFAIDWGQGLKDGFGADCFPGARPCLGHRRALMDFDGAGPYVQVGVAVVAESNPGTRIGPRLITIDFAKPNTATRFVTGVAYEDRDGDGAYSMGEGIEGLRIESGGAGTATVTSASGGYALPIPGGVGTFTVVATGDPGGASAAFPRTETEVTLSGSNVKLDFLPPPEPPVPAFGTTPIGAGSALVDGGTFLGDAQVSEILPGNRTLADVRLGVAIDHPDPREVKVELESPAGTRVVLFDGGLVPPGGPQGVFGGSLVPHAALTPFVGEDYVGTWRLRVTDAPGGATGSMTASSLLLRPSWVRGLHAPNGNLHLASLKATGAGVAGGGKLTLVGTFDAGGAVPVAGLPVLLRLRRGDGDRAEILRVDVAAAAAAGKAKFRVKPAGATSRTAFSVKLSGLDLSALPPLVDVELSAGGALVAQSVPVTNGAYKGARTAPASPQFGVTKLRSKAAGGVRTTTVTGIFRHPDADPSGLLEVVVGTGHARLSPGALLQRGTTHSAKPSGALRKATWNSRTGVFSFKLVSAHDAEAGGVSEVMLRLGTALGAATVRGTVASGPAGDVVKY